jgi:hypothetical protein
MQKKRLKTYIKKGSNQLEPFDYSKYKKSLLKSGVKKTHVADIVDEIGSPKKYFSTKELNKKTYKLLLKRSKVIAANYNLKQALYSLGPTGYPFEILCSYLFRAKGFKTRVSVVKKGEFVRHEVDVIAERADKVLYCECKFHSQKRHKNDIKLPLYVHSRYLDLKAANRGRDFTYALLTNTCFSKDAIKYSIGVGLELYAMNYPTKNNFVDLIVKYKVYPVTALHSLRSKDKKNLLNNRIVVIKQITTEELFKIGLEESCAEKVMQEVTILTRPN